MKDKCLFLILFCTLSGCATFSRTNKCLAPASSVYAQVEDLCLLKSDTNDIAHSEVKTCVSILGKVPDDCAHRTLIKKQRCTYLLENTVVANLSLDECISSMKTEGYVVQGCKYPFKKECMAEVDQGAPLQKPIRRSARIQQPRSAPPYVRY